MTPERPPTDLRKLHSDLNRNLLVLAMLVLVIGGSGAVALYYGVGPAMIAGLCLLAGAATMVFLWLVVTVMGKIAGDE